MIKQKPKSREARDKLFEENYRQLAKWVDMNDQKFVLLKIRRLRRNGKPGEALKTLDAFIKQQPTRQLLYKKRGDIFGELGWLHWQAQQEAWKVIRFPDHYPPF